MASPEGQPAAKEQPAVAATGEYWEVGDVRLYRSTDERVLLFAPTRLALRATGGGRYQAALTQFRQLQAGASPQSYQTVAGSALLALSPAAPPMTDCGRAFADCWRAALERQGYKGNAKAVFLPLVRRRQRVQVVMEREAGAGHLLGGGEMEGDAASLVVELTGRGAEEWGRFLREKGSLGGRVRWTYEYPQMLHESEASFSFEGAHFFSRPELKHGDVSLKVILRAMAWVEASVEFDFAALLQPLDETYLSVVSVDAATQFPVITSRRTWDV
jgi:hypothetical protein